MSDMNDFNSGVIEEFRANHGKVGGGFAGAPVVLLTTTGAKSGKKRVNPLVEVEFGDDRFTATAVPITPGPERDRLYAAQVAVQPGFGDYEKATTRVIPVVELRQG
jgi:hypothetical protein